MTLAKSRTPWPPLGYKREPAVLTHLDEISKKWTHIAPPQRAYLEHASSPYPLAKVLVSLTFLSGNADAYEAARYRAKLGTFVTDPTYRHQLGI